VGTLSRNCACRSRKFSPGFPLAPSRSTAMPCADGRRDIRERGGQQPAARSALKRPVPGQRSGGRVVEEALQPAVAQASVLKATSRGPARRSGRPRAPSLSALNACHDVMRVQAIVDQAPLAARRSAAGTSSLNRSDQLASAPLQRFGSWRRGRAAGTPGWSPIDVAFQDAWLALRLAEGLFDNAPSGPLA